MGVIGAKRVCIVFPSGLFYISIIYLFHKIVHNKLEEVQEILSPNCALDWSMQAIRNDPKDGELRLRWDRNSRIFGIFGQ